MKWFHNLRMMNKLVLSFVVVALLAGVVGAIGIVNMKEIDTKYGVLYEDFGVALGYIDNVQIALEQNRAALRDALLERGDKSKYIAVIRENDKQIEEQLAKFEKSVQTQEGRDELKKFKDANSRFISVRDQAIGLAMANQEAQALALMRGPVVNDYKQIDDSVNKLTDLKVSGGRRQAETLSGDVRQTMITMGAIVIAAIILAVALGVYIAYNISNPLKRLVAETEKMAQGDLNVHAGIETRDEIGRLAIAFESMADKLNEVITNIGSSASQVSAGSKQVSASSQALSQGSTEQAASIEEVTASVEEIAAQTTQNASNANRANQFATTAQDNAEQGNGQMHAMLKAMEEINDASSNISKIIKVIDEIAFQTNILALNAAVEAARAGQHGKGFAVVAEEVRNLAARSANAAKETTSMIEGSIRKVDAGTKITQDTAAALEKIVEDVANVAELVGQIATASNEQASGIAQVNQAITQVSQVVQTNSATAEESAAASEELSSQAELLRNLVSQFRTRQDSNHRRNAEPEDFEEARTNIRQIQETSAKASSGKVRIALSDNEFGKY